MTRALHELVADGSHERIDDPQALNQLDEEFLKTVKSIRAGTADPEVLADVDHASERLRRGLGALGLHEMFALMDAAALSGDPAVDKLAHKAIDTRFPTQDTGHQAYEEANQRSRKEWKKGLEIAKRTDGAKPFSHALIDAAVLTDAELGDDFDDVIIRSNTNMQQQRERMKHEKEHQQEEARREEEHQKLMAMGVEDDKNFDDAERYDPFADDDEDERAA